MRQVSLRVPATTANLGPGFDVMGMALNLYNEVVMEETDGSFAITVEGEGAELIERSEENMVYQAALRVFERTGFKPAGLRLHLKNGIPVTRGLGSSSAALVGGLAAANRLAGDRMTLTELAELATEIEGHPDNVVPALFGGILVSGTVRGCLRTVRLAPPAGLRAVVAVPHFQLSTQVARQVVPQMLAREDAIFTASHVGLMVAALIQGDLPLFGAVLEDRMHQPYRAPLIPGMEAVIREAEAAGALGVALSGAGPTMIAFTNGNEAQVSDAMKNAFAAHGVDCRVLRLEPDTQGVSFFQDAHVQAQVEEDEHVNPGGVPELPALVAEKIHL